MSLPPEELAYQEAHIHEDRSTGLTVAYVVALVVATITVALRLVARRISSTALKADDFTIILALVCSFLSTSGELAADPLKCSVHIGRSLPRRSIKVSVARLGMEYSSNHCSRSLRRGNGQACSGAPA